ncbi:sulfatase-like hydrolase/transferase [Coprobacter sp.]
MRHSKKISAWLSKQQNLYVLFTVVLMIPTCLLLYTEEMSIAMRVAYLFLPLSVYLALFATGQRPGVVLLWLSLLLIIGAFQEVLLYLFGNSIIASDMFLNLFTTSTGEASELLGNLIPAVILILFIFFGAIYLAIHSVRIKDRLTARIRRKSMLIAGCCLLIGSIGGITAKVQEPDKDVLLNIYPVNVFYNMKFAKESWHKSKNYKESSENFSFQAKLRHPAEDKEIYVLVIGETSRSDNWSLYGYERETNPRLSKEKSLVYFTDVVTQCNATHKSVPLILSAASADNFEIIYKQKSIITAFKEAGFKTAFLSNQVPNNTFTDFFSHEADVLELLRGDPLAISNNPLDHDLLPLLDKFIDDGGNNKLFIVLHTYGSHFNYRDRYSDKFRKFVPDDNANLEYRHRDLLVNSYDNSILSTDDFLASIIDRLKSTGAVTGMLYLPDHGEDIMDDDRHRFLHASPCPTYYQLHIPLLIWFSDEYNEQYPETMRNAFLHSSAPISTRAVFHTMLDLAGISTPHFDSVYSVVNSGFEPRKRSYLNDHNLPESLDNCGLKKQDEAMFKEKGMVYP